MYDCILSICFIKEMMMMMMMMIFHNIKKSNHCLQELLTSHTFSVLAVYLLVVMILSYQRVTLIHIDSRFRLDVFFDFI